MYGPLTYTAVGAIMEPGAILCAPSKYGGPETSLFIYKYRKAAEKPLL